ncbi:MAG: PDZ domain-containing protein, partial [Clostridia bacterium]|nr:PDZ domain-containing protein [Clostridia bacterium]
MIIKRILAALIAASAITTSVFAFTPYGPGTMVPENAEQDESTEVSTDEKKDGAAQSIVQQLRPSDLAYKMFEQILDAYVEKHLYDFTEQDVLHKFFEDFLKDNPAYFSLFMEYLLGTMDPYSSYYTASSNFLEPDKGSVGFGFTIRDKDDGVYVESVLPEGNAMKAGFMAGDRFVSVAGINVENQTFDVVSTILARPQIFLKASDTEKSNIESPDDKVVTNDSEEKSQETQEDKKTTEQPVIEIVVDRNGEKHTFNLSRGPMKISQISSIVDENDGKPTAFIEISSFLGDGT